MHPGWNGRAPGRVHVRIHHGACPFREGRDADHRRLAPGSTTQGRSPENMLRNASMPGDGAGQLARGAGVRGADGPCTGSRPAPAVREVAGDGPWPRVSGPASPAHALCGIAAHVGNARLRRLGLIERAGGRAVGPRVADPIVVHVRGAASRHQADTGGRVPHRGIRVAPAAHAHARLTRREARRRDANAASPGVSGGYVEVAAMHRLRVRAAGHDDRRVDGRTGRVVDDGHCDVSLRAAGNVRQATAGGERGTTSSHSSKPHPLQS